MERRTLSDRCKRQRAWSVPSIWSALERRPRWDSGALWSETERERSDDDDCGQVALCRLTENRREASDRLSRRGERPKHRQPCGQTLLAERALPGA